MTYKIYYLSCFLFLLSACAPDSGFQNNVGSYCSTPNCAKVSTTNPDIFISSESLTVQKRLTITPGAAAISFPPTVGATTNILPQNVVVTGSCTIGANPYHDIIITYWPQSNPAGILSTTGTAKCESGRFTFSFNPNASTNPDRQVASLTKTQVVYGIKAALLAGQNISTATQVAAFESVLTIEK